MKLLVLLLFLTGCAVTAVSYSPPYRYKFSYIYYGGNIVDFYAYTLHECKYYRNEAFRRGFMVLGPCWRL